jgi:mRNA interferase MazF
MIIKSFIKDFIKWLSIKRKIDDFKHTPPLFNEGEIWWCSIGENVGVEISGKGDHFRRPVLVVRKLDQYSFIGVPITSQNKVGTWYAHIKVKNNDNYVILSQIRHIDYRRIDKILFTLDILTFNYIRTEVVNLIKGV